MNDVQAKATLNALEKCINVYGTDWTQVFLRTVEEAGRAGVNPESIENMIEILTFDKEDENE